MIDTNYLFLHSFYLIAFQCYDLSTIDPSCQLELNGFKHYNSNGTNSVCPDEVSGSRGFQKISLTCAKQCLKTHVISLMQKGKFRTK